MPQVDQRPGSLDIGIVPGDDFTFTVHSPINLSGYTLSAKSGSVTFTMAATDGQPAGYYYDITITKAQSVLFTENRVWRLEWDDPATKHRTVAKGTIRLL